ncbi:hypothetical protein ACFP3U_02805 [Kitasatospora misakiensis]|uniref:Uncharacterized protein n=1 Tax=Kitasatospora misakiensis TaxID=67330 RepID=A0ABW0WWK7_9ACTN
MDKPLYSTNIPLEASVRRRAQVDGDEAGGDEGEARYRTGAHAFWRLHVAHLVREAGRPDPEVLADQLLAPLAPERITAGLTALAHGVLGHGTPGRA